MFRGDGVVAVSVHARDMSAKYQYNIQDTNTRCGPEM